MHVYWCVSGVCNDGRWSSYISVGDFCERICIVWLNV